MLSRMSRILSPESDVSGRSPLGGPFWRLWSAGVVNNLGDGALTVGIGLLATTVTHDPRLVAMVSAAATLPWLLITLPAGVLLDRVDRIAAIRVAQLAQAGVMAVLTVLAALHVVDVWTLAMLAFLVTAGDVVFSLAAQSVLPQIVSPSQLVRANSLSYLGQTIAYSFVGQSIGGVLFATSSALPFGLETSSYVVSAALLTRLRPRRRGGSGSAGPADAPAHPPRRIWRGTAEGLRWLLRHRLLRTLALVLGLNTFANQIAMSVLVLFAIRTLGVSHAGYGWMMAAFAIGGVVGGLVNTRIVRAIGSPAALVLALALNAACFAAMGFATDGYLVSALLAVVGLSVTIWNVVSVSMRQSLVPPELLGRVNSVYRLLGWGLIPVGALVGGFLAHGLGLRAPFLVTGGLRFVVLLAAAPVLLPALLRGEGRMRRREG
jgi:MFS family permease